MKEIKIEDIAYNYYLNAQTYVKTVLSYMPEEIVSSKKKALIIELFNYILSTLSKDEIKDVLTISRMFNDKMMLISSHNKVVQAEYIYHTFLEKMLFESSNRYIYFGIMNECIKVYSGYYEEYQNDYVYASSDYKVDNISIR